MAASVMESLWLFLAVAMAVLSAGVRGESASAEDAILGSSGLDLGLVVGGVACVVVLVVVVALCVEKRIHVEAMEKGPPFWTRSLQFKQEFNGGLTCASEGLNNLSPFHVIRDRLGNAVTDGARWDVGFTEDKHVFEVVWPVKKNRGTCCSIGVGSMDVPLKKQGRLSLVGHHSQSWGFDLSSRKMVHANKRTGSFQKQIPDRFFMYVDMDGGKIGFGEDVRQLGRQALFYGYLINNIRLDRRTPLHVMLGMCAPREEVQVYYIGTAVAQGGFDLVPPEQGANQASVYGGQQQQQTGQLQEVKVQNPDPVPGPATY